MIQRASEAFLGTDPIDKCADTATPFDERGPDFGEPLSPWPPDINDDGKTTLPDALRFGLHWNTVSGQDAGYSARFDLNGDGTIGVSDVLSLAPFFNQFCNAPTPTPTRCRNLLGRWPLTLSFVPGFIRHVVATYGGVGDGDAIGRDHSGAAQASRQSRRIPPRRRQLTAGRGIHY